MGRTENFEGERVLERVGWQDKFAVGAVCLNMVNTVYVFT